MAIRCLNCGARHLALPGPVGPTVPVCDECADTNACQQAFAILDARPDATREDNPAGPILYIRRKMCGGGSVTDGTRLFRVAPCIIWRWLTVSYGWGEIAEFDQRNFTGHPEKLAAAVIAAIDAKVPPQYREELTPAGPQLVIPGCERRPVQSGKPAQLDLFA